MFGKRLRKARMRRHITQQKMADTLNVALRSYQCYEGDDRSPSYELLTQIADILDVSVDWLLGRDDFLKKHGFSFDES